MRRKKILVGGIVVAAIFALVAIAVVRNKNVALKVQVSKVERRSVNSSVLASGQFEYKEQVELRSQISGQIIRLPVTDGSHVKMGQTVLRINPKTYQATVAQQQANVELQRYAIHEAKLKLSNLKLEWKRNTKLYDQGLVDANSYDQLTNQYDVAKVALSSARESLSVAKAQLQYAEEQLAKTIIKSPINGIVTALNVKVGESVIPGTVNIPGSVLMQIGDPSELLAKVYVDEADIAHIKDGEKASVTSTAYPNRPLHGKVTFVAPAATTMPGEQGEGFEVKVRLHNKRKLAIRPQMTCRAEIYTRSARQTLAIPVSAILFGKRARGSKLFSTGNAYVYVVHSNHAIKRKVKLGISSDTWQEIVSGLKQGEKVITGPYEILHRLAPGSQVSIASTRQGSVH